MRPHALPFLIAGLAACTEPFSVSVSNVGRTGSDEQGAFLYLEDSEGQALRVQSEDTEVSVWTRSEGGEWVEASSVTLEHVTPPLIDVVLVADNSGSEADYLQEIKDAAVDFAHPVLARVHDDRVGLVRVSTEASVLQPLTTSEEEFDAAADSMWVNRGWTALWDGVRMGAEVLAADALQYEDTGVCVDRAFRSVIVFTDGADNNSADEHETSYEGDGIDTTLQDLFAVQVQGVTPPIHTVGVGFEVDQAALRALSEATGGRHKDIRNYHGLNGVLHGTAAQLEYNSPFCFVPADCSHTELMVTVNREVRNGWTERSFETSLQPSCD